MKHTSKKFEIVWKVQHASLQCKQGVHSIEETYKEEGDGWLFNETMYSEVVTFEELQKYCNYTSVTKFIFEEFFPYADEVEKDDIDEYLESVCDDESVFFYERKKWNNDGSTYPIYYAFEDKLTDEELNLAKKCLDFTGEIIKRQGLSS